MAEPTQFTFDFKEVATALVKQQGLHEGLWMVSFELALVAGIIGQTPATSMPAAFVQFNKLQLIRQDQIPPPHPHLTVDAAEVNPKAKDPAAPGGASASSDSSTALLGRRRSSERKEKRPP